VFERAEVAVIEEVGDQRLLAVLEAVTLDRRHRLVERHLADERLHVVVAGRPADDSLGVRRGLEQRDFHTGTGGSRQI
jgi:hypothetical protein